MTNYIILSLCLIVLVAYLFDISSRYSRIPGVILLIALGMVIQVITTKTGLKVPDMRPVLPVIGTLGLILIVLEASLDIRLQRKKLGLLIRSVSSALFLFILFTAILTWVLVKFMGYPITDSILSSIPLGIISSAVAISSASNLTRDQKEFIVYESAFSDIIGILVFDFILLNQGSIGHGLVNFVITGLLTVVVAIAVTSGLGYLLHKITYHINYVIIMTSIVLVYVLAKIYHLPALFLVLVFGLALSNNRTVEHTVINRFVDFEKFRTDVESFRKIMGELTFLVRSFFFILFGFYTTIEGLLNHENLIAGGAITAGIFLLRWLFFGLVLKSSDISLILFAPRGLITILLFLSIPASSGLPLINEEVVTLVIFFSLAFMMVGNLFSRKGLTKAAKRISVTDHDQNGDLL